MLLLTGRCSQRSGEEQLQQQITRRFVQYLILFSRYSLHLLVITSTILHSSSMYHQYSEVVSEYWNCRWRVPVFMKKKKVSHGQQGPLRGSSSPYGTLNQQGLLDPIKLAYDQRRPDGRLRLTASTFNRLGQYASSHGHRTYCYARTCCFFPGDGQSHRQYSLCLPTEGWRG